MSENRAHCAMNGPETQTLNTKTPMYDIVFINPPNHCQEDYIPLGLKNLHAIIARDGFRTHFIDLQAMFIHKELGYTPDSISRIHDLITAAPAPIYAFTLWNTSFPWVVEMCRFIKAKNASAVTLIGGPMSTLLWEEILSDYHCIDIACRFEGETIISPLGQAILSHGMEDLSGIPNIVFRKQDGSLEVAAQAPLIDNLDTLPQIDLFPEDFSNPVVNLEAGRGCSFHCYYCSSCYVWQFKPRYKSGARLFSEIDHLCRRYKDRGMVPPVLHLEHDNFLMNPKVLEELDEKVRESGLAFHYGFAGRADLITPRNLDLLKQTGCAYVYLGIETGSPRMQEITRKHLSFARMYGAIEHLQERSIMVHANLMYGFPEERLPDLYATLDMINRLRFLGVHVHVSLLSPEMKTPVGDGANPSDFLFNNSSRYGAELADVGFCLSDYKAIYVNHLYTLRNHHYDLPFHHKFIQFWHPLVTACPMTVHRIMHKHPWHWDQSISRWEDHGMPAFPAPHDSLRDLFRIFDDTFGHDPEEMRILDIECRLKAHSPNGKASASPLPRSELAFYYRHFAGVRRETLFKN